LVLSAAASFAMRYFRQLSSSGDSDRPTGGAEATRGGIRNARHAVAGIICWRASYMLSIGTRSGLLTDLYELTMAAGYFQCHFQARATFELFVRHLPSQRNYLVAAGLDQALEYLENVRFSHNEIGYLRGLPLFRSVCAEFFEYLADFRFTGDVWAMPEGTIFFPNEPLLRVTAPIIEAQLMETSLLSAVHLQTLIASKAARVTTAAAGRPVIEFGSRRAHGIEAGVLAARAAFIGGCEGTSNSYAGYQFGIPTFGTQAHSWIMAHEDEGVAFSNFLRVFPKRSTLLVDTYDVRAAIEKIIALGQKPGGIRLDSGDVLADSIWVREKFKAAGWDDVQIFVSGDLNEDRIAEMLRDGGCADAFGVGTALSTSGDAPSVGVIYKLVEVEFHDHIRRTAKFSVEKKTYPGRKQVFRFSRDERYARDVIGLEDEIFAGTERLLVQVMRDGKRLQSADRDPVKTAARARQRFIDGRQRLSPELVQLSPAERPYPVAYSDRIEKLCSAVRKTVVKSSPTPSVAGADPRSTKTIFWEVDVQADFMFPGGKLYVSGAEKIIPNVDRLVDLCRQGRVFLISETDCHSPDDPEMRSWPLHCLKGTAGAEIVPEARALNYLIIPNQPGFAFPEDLDEYQQVVLEKNTLDVFDNPNTDALLGRLVQAAHRPFDPNVEFVVFGIATEYCVRCTVEGLLRRGRHVAIVVDAIESIDREKGRKILEDLRSHGARLITAADALAAVAPLSLSA
jgi:nicotinate phosphoribosyltransferase